MNLFNLFATLTLDNSDYEKKLNQSQKSAGSFSSKIGTAFKTGVRAVAGFITGVAAASAAIGALVVNFVNAGSEIDDNAQKLGVSTEAYQYWSLVLQRVGSDASNLSMMIRNMTTFTQNLSEGNADALITLQKLGIGYEEFMAMSTEEQLYAIVEALQGMENQTDKVAIAQEIFGTRTYQELLPLLNMEQGSLQDLQAEFEGLGLIMSDDTVKSIAAVGDRLDNLGNLFKITGITIMADFLPEINNILDAFTALVTGSTDVETAMGMIGDSLVSVITTILRSAPDILDAAADLVINIIDGMTNAFTDQQFISDLINFVVQFVTKIAGVLPTLTADILQIANVLIESIANVNWSAFLSDFIDIATEIIVNIVEALPTLVKNFVSLAISLIEGIVNAIPKLLSSIGEIAIAIIDALIQVNWIELFVDLMGTIANVILVELPSMLMDVMKSLIEKVFNLFFTKGGQKTLLEFGKSIAEGILNGLISSIESGLNIVIGSINNVLGAISTVWTWAGIPEIPEIPNVSLGRVDFAEGGMFPTNMGTLYALAGESGAEIVARGARGTGVANIEQIADAQYMAMQDYDLRGAIQQAAVAVVNGIVAGLSNQDGNTEVTVRIGDREFNSYIVNTVNDTLRAQGRKSLRTVTAYK